VDRSPLGAEVTGLAVVGPAVVGADVTGCSVEGDAVGRSDGLAVVGLEVVAVGSNVGLLVGVAVMGADVTEAVVGILVGVAVTGADVTDSTGVDTAGTHALQRKQNSMWLISFLSPTSRVCCIPALRF
jgi:hypothetical protein